MPTLSKSDFKVARECVTKLYYRKMRYPSSMEDDPYLQLLAQGGYMVERLAKTLHPDGTELPTTRTDADFVATRAALAAPRGTWFEASLRAGSLTARVDILQRRDDVFDLIEVKSTSIDSHKVEAHLAKGAPSPFRAVRRPHALLGEWVPYLEDVAFQVLVLQRMMPGARVRPWLLVVDTAASTTIDRLWAQFDIRRDVTLPDGRVRDLEVTFTGDPQEIRDDHFLVRLDVGDEVHELLPSIEADADRLAALLTEAGPERQQRPVDWACRDCEFTAPGPAGRSGFRECWGPLGDDRPEIFDLYALGTVKSDGERLADRLIAEGRIRLTDVDPDQLVRTDGTPGPTNQRQLVQLRHTRLGQPWVSGELGPALAGWSYPLHFIDFETSALAVPYHAGMAPYEQVAFQWSCHTIAEPGAPPVHREWLNRVDAYPNEAFAESLRDAIGDDGTPLMWATHERTVLRRIGEQLRRYGRGTEALVAWCERMGARDDGRLVDLNAICRQHYFHPGMGGRTSIKKVLDALWGSDGTMRVRFEAWSGLVAPDGDPYAALPPVVFGDETLTVADGTGAMTAYQEMLYGASRHDEARNAAWAELLKAYCRLDTLAMVLIWDHWRRQVDGRP